MKSYVRTLAAACCLSLLLTGCATQYARPTPPEKCPPIPEDVDSQVDSVIKELLAWFIDEYTRCAAKIDAQHE
ncbi:hypothetical protein GCM10025759_19150 [Lysobacter panacisoli]|uniref:Entry exclusion lipoprotein TrbK n=1 Tax=Lysobacter panacisoli TaxID=1255263 RepID=A0ABP9LG36_9GAMM